MDQIKSGALIRRLRQERSMTQSQLAALVGVSDKAVSKWENGRGAPDVALLPALSETLGVELLALLQGDTAEGAKSSGDLNRIRFYVCPHCGELFCATGDSAPSCCGRTLTPLIPQSPPEDEALDISLNDGAWYITGDHEMRREHHISFLAMRTGDTLLLRRLYPEWELETRLPYLPHGTLLWYCTRHGLFARTF